MDGNLESMIHGTSSVTHTLWNNATTSSAAFQVEEKAQDNGGASISDVPATSTVQDYQTKGLKLADVGQEIGSKYGPAPLPQHPQQRPAAGGAGIKCHACRICGPAFSTRKSLLRHLRTVHQAKAFRCSSCQASFSRNDILLRHATEHHTANTTRVHCIFCAKDISMRVFLEHLGSQACTQARLKMRTQKFDDLRFGLPGQDDDAFLVTIRMFIMLNLKLSFNADTGEAKLTSAAFVRNEKGELSKRFQHSAAWERLYIRVLHLTSRQIDRDVSALYIFAALWASALLLGLLTFSRGCDNDAWAHWKGAAAVLATRHNRTCDCGCYESCKRWQGPTNRDPTLALVARILEEHGFMNEAAAPCFEVNMSDNVDLRNMCIHHFQMLEAFLTN